MKPRTVAVLALLVAALAAFVFFYERELPSSDERAERERKVFRVEPDAIERIEIESGDRRLELQREASAAAAPEEGETPLAAPPEWRIVSPLTARADRALVSRLTSELAGLQISRRLEGAAPEEIGLDEPRGRIVWHGAEGEGSLEIGADVPATSRIIVSASGSEEPLVVSGGLLEHLERSPGDWRAKELVDAGREEIERIRILPREGEEVVLSRLGERFRVERPYADAADRDLVEPLLGELASLRAERFLDAPLGDEIETALAVGPGRIELSLAGRTSPLAIEIGAALGAEEERPLRVDGQAVIAAARLEESIAHDPPAWRSGSWSDFDSWRVERLRVEDSAGTLELVREGGDWSRDGRAIPYTVAADLLHSITSARADRVLAPADSGGYPIASPEMTVILSDAAGAEETLTAYAPRGDSIPARASGRQVVLLLPALTLAEIEDRVAAVRAAEPELGEPDEEPGPVD